MSVAYLCTTTSLVLLCPNHCNLSSQKFPRGRGEKTSGPEPSYLCTGSWSRSETERHAPFPVGSAVHTVKTVRRETNQQQWYTMAVAAANFSSSTLDKLIESVGHVYGVDGFKPLQKLCLATLLKGQDVLACLPTGYGKSLIYQAWPTLSDMLARDGHGGAENGIVIVISPLTS